MKVGDKFTKEIYPENIAEITITTMDENGYSYEIAFTDGRMGVGYKSWSDRDALPREDGANA